MRKVLLILALAASSCGTEEVSDLDIVNGEKVYRSFYGRMEVGRGFRCGSTLVHDGKWAVCAKHCLENPKHHDKVKLRFGAYDMKSGNNGGKPWDLVKVSKVFLHPDVDLALLKLRRKAKFKPLPFSDKELPERFPLQAYGMGNVALKSGGQGILRGVRLQVKKGPNRKLIYTFASPEIGGVCYGDSGGPLVARIDGKTTLVGAAAWTGSQCASQKGRDGFARPDVQWIKSIIRRN